MALPTKIKTWQYANNLNPGYGGSDEIDCDNLFILVKNAMKDFDLNPWTVAGSSDAVTAAMDTADRIDVHTAIVHSGGAHSWIVLQQDALSATCQVLFDWLSSDGKQVYVYFSPVDGFTGGSTTARPTATDEVSIRVPWDMMWTLNSGGMGTTMRAHVQMSNDGLCTRVFFCANKQVKSWFLIDRPINPPAGWTAPSIMIMPPEADQSIPNYTLSFNYHRDNPSVYAVGPGGAMPMYLALQGFATNGTDNGTLLGYDSWPNPDELTDEFPMAHVGIANKDTVGMRGYHGYIADMWSTARSVGSGNSFPDDGSKDFINLGHFAFPWNGDDIEMP